MYQTFLATKPKVTIGARVRVSPTCEYASDFAGDFIVTGIEFSAVRGKPRWNITIISQDEMIQGCGAVDGFSDDDLIIQSED